ncbi:glycosyltransferase [Tumidithrix elongata RA019]|uniref:Glycosyltransferase n=1 Tax=Tumidithrix elongata BACA0141 TaxID=2716417 RepID=A0AAW9Q8V6_9CYAN|nr:glycosyltransferase [Tumidithrix elongata RA019]
MPTLKLMFFVNASEVSAGGVRAKMFSQRLPKGWDIRFNYRPAKKWKGILPFIQSALGFRPDIIYVMDTAYTGVLAGRIAKQILGCKLIVDTGDVAYELAKSTGNYSKRQLGLINWIEQMAIKNSDRLIVRGSYHKTLLESQGVQNVVFIPDGVDTLAVSPGDYLSLKTELGLADSFVVGMVGTMIWSERHCMCYGWDVIEALSMLKDLPVKALLIGDGDGRQILEARAKELGISDRAIFTGQLPYEKMLRYLTAMDVCVSTQSNDLVGMVRTTGKLPLYLAYGKYVIATNVGEAMRVLPGIGCLLPYEGVRDALHPTRLAEHIRMLVAEPERIKVAEAAFQVAKENFDYALLAQRLTKVCEDLCDR